MLGKRLMLWISAGVAWGSSVAPQSLLGTVRGHGQGLDPTTVVARNVASRARPPQAATSPGVPSAEALPDSILARIGDGRDIVRSFAVRRWRETHATAMADSITPAAASGFLDLLVDEAVLTEAAVREAAPWAAADSVAHRALRDRLALAVSLDSVLADTRAHVPNGASLDADSTGALARDRVVARLGAVFDDSALAGLARAFARLPRPSADSSLDAQLRALGMTPRLEAGDSNVVLARSTVGDVRAGQVVAAWARLSVAYRPRVDTREQVRDLVCNQLFERVLRRASMNPRIEADPRVAAALASAAAEVSRRHYLERHVLADIVVDSATIVAYWGRHAGEWRLPLRVRGIRLVFDDRAAAVRMAVTLGDAAAAESLATRAARQGVDYRFVVAADNDSALFRSALAAGPGAVLGPAYRDGAWFVARVAEVLPGRDRSLAEVRGEIAARCFADQAEQRSRALAARLRATMRVVVDPIAANHLAAALRESARTSPVPGSR